VGPLKVVHSNDLSDEAMRKIEEENYEVKVGGKWSPKCQARHKVSSFFFQLVFVCILLLIYTKFYNSVNIEFFLFIFFSLYFWYKSDILFKRLLSKRKSDNVQNKVIIKKY